MHTTFMTSRRLLVPLLTLVAISGALAITLHARGQGSATRDPTADRRAGNDPARVAELLRNPPTGEVLVVAHRGHHQHAPENSIAAIHHAADIGAHIVEIDIHGTADGHLVLMHDWNIGRTTTGWGEMDSFTLQDIRSLRLLHGVRVTPHRVPTLSEALDAARGRVMLNLDLKGIPLEQAAALADELGLIDHCLFKVEWTPAAAAAAPRWRERWPGMLLMPLVQNEDQLRAALADTEGVPIEVAVRGIDPVTFGVTFADPVTQADRHLWCNALGDWGVEGLGDYAVFDSERSPFAALAELGVSIIQTDLPERALADLAARDPARTHAIP